jgi:hypothetical protein
MSRCALTATSCDGMVMKDDPDNQVSVLHLATVVLNVQDIRRLPR